MNALCFHHVEDKKEAEISRLKTVPKVLKEIKKCIVVCANCHAEIHENELSGQIQTRTTEGKQFKLYFL